MRVLLVEDEKKLADEIAGYLKKEGYVCDRSLTFSSASENIAVSAYDFILLDLGLPDGEGLDLIFEIKKNQENAIIIILTARSEISDRVEGLEKGADDYLPKPFSLLELKARMQAIVRRKSGWNKEEITIGSFMLDLGSKTVSYSGNPISLTKKEFNVLHFLVIHKNRVINRYQLAEHLWGDHIEDDYQSNFIDVHIKNIRKKLGEFAPVDWLETIRGIGYKIQA
jgi:DNA-binding response OmpR family regulator